MNKVTKEKIIQEIFISLNLKYLRNGVKLEDLESVWKNRKRKISYSLISSAFLLLIAIAYHNIVFKCTYNYFLGVRCLVPNNYFVWEATRPISNCNFCNNVNEPIILPNLTREEFKPYAYTSLPVVVKNAFSHWPAMQKFDFNFFKTLYNKTEDATRNVDEECQFLHFKSDFISLKDVFAMSQARILNKPGENSWYVGWGNCHPQILLEMRKFYPKPHFLPENCEIPFKEYVFMGYDDGATIHLDFINRLMWQAQLRGTKLWHLIPPPECQNICSPINFIVEPGDAVLVDTRVWYHGTTISPGQFSLSIQSEYG